MVMHTCFCLLINLPASCLLHMCPDPSQATCTRDGRDWLLVTWDSLVRNMCVPHSLCHWYGIRELPCRVLQLLTRMAEGCSWLLVRLTHIKLLRGKWKSSHLVFKQGSYVAILCNIQCSSSVGISPIEQRDFWVAMHRIAWVETCFWRATLLSSQLAV